MRDPYAVLGVKRDADASEIKSAWRTIAKKTHPDQNRSDPNAAKLFAEVGEAYETLRDPKKRSRYDLLTQSGKQGATIQQQREAAREAAARQKAAEENARKVMEELARAEAEKARKAAAQKAAQPQAEPQTGNPQSGAQQSAGQQQPNGSGQKQAGEQAGSKSGDESPEDVINRIFGAQPQFATGPEGQATGGAYGAQEQEPERSGTPSGSANSGKPLPIAAVEAITAFIRRLTGGGSQMEKAPDQFAEARVTIEDLLKENWITVALPEGRELRFRLDAGVTDGQAIRLKGQGFKVPGMGRGDAVVTLRVEPSPLFRVSGHDILTPLPVSLENAVLGCNAMAESPTGPVEVQIPAWSGSDQTIRVPGLGLHNGQGGRGDLVVEVRLMLWEKPDAKVTDLMRSMREGLYL